MPRPPAVAPGSLRSSGPGGHGPMLARAEALPGGVGARRGCLAAARPDRIIHPPNGLARSASGRSTSRGAHGSTPRSRGGAGLHRPGLPVPRGLPRGRHPAELDGRGRPRRHRAGPLRARRHLGHDAAPAVAAAPRRRLAVLRSHRRGGRPDALLHRAHRGQRRSAGAGHRRLAGPGGRAVLPRHRAATTWAWPGAGTSPPGAGCCSTSRTSCSATPPPPSASIRSAAPNGISGHGALISALETVALGQARRHRRHHPGRAGRDHPGRAARACWWCRAVPARARRWWRCTAPPTCCTPTGSRSRARACWWWAPTGCSSATSSRCCRRWARPASSWRCWPTWSTTCAVQGRDTRLTARVKGDLRMVKVLRRAVHDRERPLRRDLVVGYGLTNLRMTVAESEHIVGEARRRFHRHNAGRRFVEAELFGALARIQPRGAVGADGARSAAGHARGARGAGVDVAGAHPGPAAARPVRVAGAAAQRRAPPAVRRRVGRAGPAPRPRRSTRWRGPTTTRPCSTRPGPCSAPSPGSAAPVPTRPTTRCAPTATSWSTRPRTCRPCSCGCWSGDRSTAR